MSVAVVLFPFEPVIATTVPSRKGNASSTSAITGNERLLRLAHQRRARRHARRQHHAVDARRQRYRLGAEPQLDHRIALEVTQRHVVPRIDRDHGDVPRAQEARRRQP